MKNKKFGVWTVKNLTESDKNYFLTSGVLTYPFVSNEYVLEKVLCDY